MSVVGPARLSLRAPPHLPFVQGFPGIPADPNRPPASVSGTVELRVGVSAIKAKWVRVEIRKFEQPPLLPPSSNSAGSSKDSAGPTWDHIGPVLTVWSAAAGREFESLDTTDFKFNLPLPEAIPPSFDGGKGAGGVRYELVAALCYKAKGGIFKKEAAPIMKVSEPLRIVKHELHAGWPLYNTPEGRSVQGSGGTVSLFVERPGVAFGPTDKMVLTATLKSANPHPFRLKGFECHLVEVVTVFPAPVDPGAAKPKKSKAPPPPQVRRRTIASSRAVLNETMGSGSEKSARLDVVVPSDKLSVTVKNARTFEISHECVVEAVCEGLQGKVVMPGIRCILGPLPRTATQQTIRDIGHFDALCPPLSTPAGSSQTRSTASSPGPRQSPDPRPRPGSGGYQPPQQFGEYNNSFRPPSGPSGQHGFQPPNQPGFQSSNQPIQGFVARDPSRRKSSSTTTTTTTTATTMTHGTPAMANNEFGGQRYPAERMYSTMPNSQGRPPPLPPPVSFPVPSPTPRLSRSGSVPRSLESRNSMGSLASPTNGQGEAGFERYSQSEMGHGDGYDAARRLSTATAATFGRWDLNLNSAIREDGTGLASPISPTPTTPVVGNHRLSDGLLSPPGPMSPRLPSSSGSASRPTPPSAWTPTVGNEKEQLYDQARARAAAAQHASGVPLDAIGMDDIAPPEYAPPRPIKPAGEEYAAPSRPVSSYSNRPVANTPPPGATPSAGTSKASGSGLPLAAVGGAGPLVLATPPPPPSMPTEYLSAAEEKEQQKKRFEEAHRRVASGTFAGSSSLATDSPATTAPPPAIEVSKSRAASPAISKSALASSSGHSADRSSALGTASTSTNPTTAETGPPPPPIASGSNGSGPGYMTAAEEKQRLRYEMAISNRDSHMRSLSQSTVPGSPSGSHLDGSAAPSGSKQTTVNGSQINGTSKDGPVPYDAIFPPSATPGPSTQAQPTSKPQVAAYMSAEEEKEAMRKRFEEAQQRVARAQGQVPPRGSPVPSGSPVASGSGSGSGFAPAPTSPPLHVRMGSASIGLGAAPSTGYMTAEQEKEMMKRRYEDAQRKVSAAAAAASPPGTPGIPGTPPPGTPPPFSPQPGSSSFTTQAKHMTAEEEKEMMRRRYEEATSKVARARLSSPPPPPFEAGGGPSGSMQMGATMDGGSPRSLYTPAVGVASGSGSGGGAVSGGGGGVSGSGGSGSGFMSAEEEKQLQKQRFEMAQNAVNHRMSLSTSGAPPTSPPVPPQVSPNPFRDHSVKAGKARAVSGTFDGVVPADEASTAGKPYNPFVRDASRQAPTAASALRGIHSAAAAVPPPPLPAKPPQEYINLLSPVTEGSGGGDSILTAVGNGPSASANGQQRTSTIMTMPRVASPPPMTGVSGENPFAPFGVRLGQDSGSGSGSGGGGGSGSGAGGGGVHGN